MLAPNIKSEITQCGCEIIWQRQSTTHFDTRLARVFSPWLLKSYGKCIILTLSIFIPSWLYLALLDHTLNNFKCNCIHQSLVHSVHNVRGVSGDPTVPKLSKSALPDAAYIYEDTERRPAFLGSRASRLVSSKSRETLLRSRRVGRLSTQLKAALVSLCRNEDRHRKLNVRAVTHFRQ